MQDLNDMMYFAEVVDKRSFAAAGRSLGLPKSRLSRRIAELETRLGVRLMQRTTRSLSLTAIGEIFHRHCVAMREEAQAAEQLVAQSHTEPRGTIRIACPVTLAQTTIGPLLTWFLAQHPQVSIDMRVSNRAVDLVEEGFDLALRVRPSLDDSGSMVVKNLGPTHAVLVASPHQIGRQGQPMSPQDLAAMDTLAMSALDGMATWQLQGPDGDKFVLNHRPRLVADDLLTLMRATMGGVGISAIPDYMCHEELQRGALTTVLPDWSPQPAIVHAVFPSRRGLVPAVRLLLDFLGEQLRVDPTAPATGRAAQAVTATAPFP